jgi:hypothetical protein
MAGRSLILRTGLAVGSLAGLLGVAEVALRLLQRPFPPGWFQTRNAAPASSDDGLAVAGLAFDPRSFWHRVGAPPLRREGTEFLLLVLGDERALDRTGAGGSWPEIVAYLVGLNESARELRVLNAAEPGYSSFQGVRRFAQLAGLLPDAVCFAFGRNDARGARTPDVVYAERLEGLGALSASWLALHAAHVGWAWAPRGVVSPRVSPSEFRAHAESFVQSARALGALPILVAGGPAPYDAALQGVAGGSGARLLAESEPRRLAESLMDVLAAEGIVLSHRRRAAEVRLGPAGEAPSELTGGWRPATTTESAAGWTFDREASVSLERLAMERGVAIDLTCPDGFAGRVQVDGGAGHDLAACRGREWHRLSLAPTGGDAIEVRFVDESRSGGGLIVHSVRLAPSGAEARLASDGPYSPGLDLAEAGDDRPELGPGLWPLETWTDGRRGRWTARDASFWLARRGAERGLLLDVSLQRPDNVTVCRIEANGVPVYDLRTRNGRHRFGIDIQRVKGRVVHVRLVVDRTFVPGDGDGRALGLFVHSVRLADSEVP